jgi:hypothetical protein
VAERFAGKASFHQDAEKEFLEAADEYATKSDDLADEFEAEVRRGIELILPSLKKDWLRSEEEAA